MNGRLFPGALCALALAGCRGAREVQEPAMVTAAEQEPTRAVPAEEPWRPPEPLPRVAVQPKPVRSRRVVYRLRPAHIEPPTLTRGTVVRNGLPEGIEAGIAAQTFESRWYAKHIKFVPGRELLKATEDTVVRFRYKLGGADQYVMQFFSAAREDNVKYHVSDAEQDEWVEMTLSLYDDMGFEVGEDVSELSWHLGKPGDTDVSLVVCDVVFYEEKQ